MPSLYVKAKSASVSVLQITCTFIFVTSLVAWPFSPCTSSGGLLLALNLFPVNPIAGCFLMELYFLLKKTRRLLKININCIW